MFSPNLTENKSVAIIKTNLSILFRETFSFLGESYATIKCSVTQSAGFLYTGCPRRNGKNFGRVFLKLNYTDITQNTYIQS